jgi:hypothetical protein
VESLALEAAVCVEADLVRGTGLLLLLALVDVDAGDEEVSVS